MRDPSALRQGRGPWLDSPLWDSIWMLSGLWLLAIVVCAQSAGYVPLVPDLLGLAGVAVLWGGHIVSPVVVSWANRDLRAHMLRNRRTFIVVPLGLLVASVGLGVMGDLSQWSDVRPALTLHMNPRLMLFYTFLLWNLWHFASQHFGVLSIYRRLSGQVSPRDRWLDRAFCVVMTCVLTPLAWYAQDRQEIFGQLFAYLPRPSTVPALGTAIVVAAGVLTLVYIAVERRKPHASLPRGLYVLSIGIQPIFGAISYPLYQAAVWSVCHWLIALGLASRILHSEVTGVAAAERRSVAPVRGLQPGFLMGVFVFALVSIGMFFIFHSRTFHGIVGIVPASPYSQDSLFSYQTGVFQWAFGALSGAYFGMSFIHFMYDRCLYAFRRPEIREWIAPHLFPAVATQDRLVGSRA